MDCSTNHFGFKEKGKNVHLYSKLISEGVTDFGTWREVFIEMRYLEKMLGDKYSRAVIYTGIDNDHFMKILVKLGYQPYHINLKRNSIWFQKPIGGNNGR